MTDPKKYQPDHMVLEGSKLWEERRALNAKHGKISEAKFQAEKQKLYGQWRAFHLSKVKEARGKECPTLLNLKLKHGDFVIMHGAEIQTFFEVGCPQFVKEVHIVDTHLALGKTEYEHAICINCSYDRSRSCESP